MSDNIIKDIRKELKSNCLRFLIITLCVAAAGVYLRDQSLLSIAYGFGFITFLFGAYEAYKSPEGQAFVQKIRTHDEGDD